MYYFNIVEILSRNNKGYLLIVLHAHLPYIRYPEHERHLEENWLYEAITETYIPLLKTFENLQNDNVDFRITLSLTPTLIEMFNDPLLRERYQGYLNNLIELSEKEIFRTHGDIRLQPVARMYNERFLMIRHLFENTYRKDLTSEFGSLMDSGNIEIITSAATHAYLPALMIVPDAVKAQILLASEHYRHAFGKIPDGIWLPECGFSPGIDRFVNEAGIDFFFLESHGILNSIPKSRNSIYAPVRTPSGAIAFARDVESAKQVWSSVEGYPGDFDYRDFYRDIGFDLDYEYIKTYLPSDVRTFTGIKYFRITDTSDNKQTYIREKALKKAKSHALHFLKCREEQVRFLNDRLKIKPVVTAAYDAELFGHWWFEGPEWLDFFLREGSRKKESFRFITPREYLSDNKVIETVEPSMSSWGYKGYSSTWIDGSNSWIYRHLHKAAKQMIKIAADNIHANGLLERALNQAARELLLAQASDWPFMMKTGNASEFAGNKFKEHIGNFFELFDQIDTGHIDKEKISRLENKNSIFRDIDFRIYIGS
ncbi:MAG: 1,4-alpha-glucan branching protein domain-containing protein [Nitrospirota bacterium]